MHYARKVVFLSLAATSMLLACRRTSNLADSKTFTDGKTFIYTKHSIESINPFYMPSPAESKEFDPTVFRDSDDSQAQLNADQPNQIPHDVKKMPWASWVIHLRDMKKIMAVDQMEQAQLRASFLNHFSKATFQDRALFKVSQTPIPPDHENEKIRHLGFDNKGQILHHWAEYYDAAIRIYQKRDKLSTHGSLGSQVISSVIDQLLEGFFKSTYSPHKKIPMQTEFQFARLLRESKFKRFTYAIVDPHALEKSNSEYDSRLYKTAFWRNFSDTTSSERLNDPSIVGDGVLRMTPTDPEHMRMDLRSKHAMHSGLSLYVRYAGEIEFNKDTGVITIDNASGTFAPYGSHLVKVFKLMKRNFPNDVIRVKSGWPYRVILKEASKDGPLVIDSPEDKRGLNPGTEKAPGSSMLRKVHGKVHCEKIRADVIAYNTSLNREDAVSAADFGCENF